MKKSILVVTMVALVFVSCQLDTSGQYIYKEPENINDGIAIGSLEEVNIDRNSIERAVNAIQAGRFKEIHSILIFKDDKLVLEEYFQGHQYKWDGPGHHGEWVTWNQEMLHMIASDTKSVTSACIGIALDKGFIQNVNQSIFDYLPEYQHLKKDGKEKITIEHLLTMTSGLRWDEWGAPLSSPANDIIGLWFNCEDQIECILERQLVTEPGTNFTYCGANHILLGEIIRSAAGMGIDEFSQKYLFEPMGVDSSNWSVRYPNGVIEAAGGLELTPRAMAKLGITFLNNGEWNEEQIISKRWVEKSAKPYGENNRINIPGVDSGRNGYSYSWWTKQYFKSGTKINMYNAGGWGGQEIKIFPELNMVVVFTGGTYTSKTKTFTLLEKYILPAVEVKNL